MSRSPWRTISAPSSARARSQGHEVRRGLERPRAVPLGHDEQGRPHPRWAQRSHSRTMPSASAGVTSWIERAGSRRHDAAVDVEDAVQHGVPAVVRLGVPAAGGAERRRSPCSRRTAASARAPASPEAKVRAGTGATHGLGHAAAIGGQQRRPRSRGPRAPRVRTSRWSTGPRPGRPRRAGRPAGRGRAETAASGDGHSRHAAQGGAWPGHRRPARAGRRCGAPLRARR